MNIIVFFAILLLTIGIVLFTLGTLISQQKKIRFLEERLERLEKK